MVVLTKRIDDMTKGKSEKGKKDKENNDEGSTKIRAFMAITEDEPSVGKADARSGQWIDITMKKVHRLLSMTNGDERKHVLDNSHVDLHYVEDQRKNLVIEKWTYSKVTLDQLLSEQVPRNIVKALGGKGRRKEKISSKEVVFTKANESSSTLAPEITSDSESECDSQEPLPPLLKLIGAAPSGTLESLISLSDLTLNMADLTLDTPEPKKTRPSAKVSPAYVIKKNTEKSHVGSKPCFDKKADSSIKQLLLTLMEESANTMDLMTITLTTVSSTMGVKYVVVLHMKHLTALRNTPTSEDQGLPTGNQNPLKSGFTKGTNLCENICAGLPQEDSGPKVVFEDDSSGDTKGYHSVNCNGITFTRVAYVNGLKHNLIIISQLCDANYKVLFTKTQGTIYNQNDKVVLIAPRRRDIYVIDMSSFNKESNACFFTKASPSINWLWHKILSHLNFKNINNLAKHNLVSGLSSLTFSKDKNCSTCEKGKHHRASFKTKRSFSINKSLHLLHMDLFGPIENLNEVRVKELRSDNGTEFRNHKLEEFCDENDISQNLSSPCTPEKSGVAERRNSTLIETSYDVFRGISPDIIYFHVFGCPVHIHNHRDHLGKLDEKTDDRFFLGYPPVAKAFRVFNIRRQEMKETVHVRFSEDDESIYQSSTEGDAINFNENRSFPDDEFLEPRKSVISEDPPEFTEAENHPALNEPDQAESTNLLESAEPQNNVIIEPIIPQDRWSREKYIELVNIIGEPLAGITTRSRIRDLDAASSSECLYVNFLSEMEVKKLIKALEGEGLIIAMQEELNQFERNKEGIDYEETFVPVARLEAIRIFLAYAAYMGFMMYHMDVKSAFLNGKILEEVYVQQPPGFESSEYPNQVYKLDKALYRLKQAPRACKQFGKLMTKKYKMSMMGELTYFMGFQIKQDFKGISICQEIYVKDLLKKYDLADCASVKCHMRPLKNLGPDELGVSVNETLFKGMIRSLMYLTASRPDNQFSTCLYARYQANPKESHLVVVKRIFRYLKGTPNLGLWYPKRSGFDLKAYSDSDYVGCNLDRKSTSGGCQIRREKLVFLWIKSQLADYDFFYDKAPIFCDNTSVIVISNNPVLHSKTKHIDIRYHFIRDHILKGDIELHFVPTDLQLANIFTKPLAEPSFTRLVAELGNLNVTSKLKDKHSQYLIQDLLKRTVEDQTRTITFLLSWWDKPISFTQDEFVSAIDLPICKDASLLPSKEILRAGLATLVAKLSEEPEQSLLPPSGEVNADDTADKSLYKASVQPVIQSKATTDLKTKKKKILPSSKPKSPHKSIEDFELAKEQENQPSTTKAVKETDIQEKDEKQSKPKLPTYPKPFFPPNKAQIQLTGVFPPFYPATSTTPWVRHLPHLHYHHLPMYNCQVGNPPYFPSFSMAVIDSKEAQKKLKAGICFRITSHNKHTWVFVSTKKHRRKKRRKTKKPRP
ncbi:retrovirus-related pol polyprotein from transposon TNT 1-94 [Tanacetum coccineum]|uniref:Retrovirus-related pol polyprotein from transposon TNT 1-94 n=1 Tax=Tanacetum coccineum TaxID=301880 RepID=A0ABQ5ANB3_9ASTR